MGIKKLNPVTPGQRFKVAPTFEDITTDKPYKPLIATVKRTGGRNNQGKRTMRYIGGGHKRQYRLIDFLRSKHDVSAKVLTIEYDPNRSARIALVEYADGEKRYILAPIGLNVGDTVVSGANSDIKPGNCLPLTNIPLGTIIHNVEVKKNGGAQLVRTAGAGAQLMAKEGEFANLRLPSGEMRLIHIECMATIGQVGNVEHENVSIGKAGRSRWLGKRPANRGVVMNPIDHPHGGGEGRSPIGRAPVTPWGKPALGHRTRKHKASDRLIVKRRA